ncbi:uncharacterized protein LOC134186199 [Corticium candelabrum]|uniref:uncharacterized protein LOC134186199 n=1 Tax=Corticium candelabrum TaxID=121492 RepID=UPI002E268CAA|nr:uncharacterized protein LOC134186199 [Corticium candelabrum]
MTHNERRTHWFKEGLIGLGVGCLYGTTSVAVGHPFDTIKTKMQAQAGFEKTTMLQTLTRTLRTQGIKGLYRGCIPPLWGSGIFRSTQFAVFEAAYTFMDGTFVTKEIPNTGGLQIRVVLGGVIASSARAVIETPLELAKVRRQTGQTWSFNRLYQGFGVTWIRTVGLMTTYFILIDSIRRHYNDLFQRPLIGPFLVSGFAATFAWWVVWPFENMKSQVQADYGEKMPLWKRMQLTVREKGGFFALYRGIGPGSVRSFIANGTSMIVMSWAQRKVSQLGLRI